MYDVLYIHEIKLNVEEFFCPGCNLSGGDTCRNSGNGMGVAWSSIPWPYFRASYSVFSLPISHLTTNVLPFFGPKRQESLLFFSKSVKHSHFMPKHQNLYRIWSQSGSVTSPSGCHLDSSCETRRGVDCQPSSGSNSNREILLSMQWWTFSLGCGRGGAQV